MQVLGVLGALGGFLSRPHQRKSSVATEDTETRCRSLPKIVAVEWAVVRSNGPNTNHAASLVAALPRWVIRGSIQSAALPY